MRTPEEEFEKIIEKEKPHHLVYFKIIFLLVIIFLGMGIFRFFSEQIAQASNFNAQTKSQTLESILGISTGLNELSFSEVIQNQLSQNKTAQKVLDVKNQITNVATGGASQQEEGVVSNLIDNFYDTTILNLLQEIIGGLPQDQQDRLIQQIEN